jgi:hypothetical protein
MTTAPTNPAVIPELKQLLRRLKLGKTIDTRHRSPGSTTAQQRHRQGTDDSVDPSRILSHQA